MTKDPDFVSVRLPSDVAIWLREYATANNMVRADKPNMGGSIIAIVRAAMQGQTISNNVGQSSDNPDIKKELDSLRSLVVSFDWRIEQQKDAIAPLVARIEALETTPSEATAPANFTPALLQKAKAVAPDVAESSLEPDALPIIEAIENIAAPSIENPLPDETLNDAIAASAKLTKKKSKSKKTLAEIDVEQAYELAKSRGYGGSINSFKQDFSRGKETFGSKFGLERWKKEEGHTKPYSYRDIL